MRCRIGLIFGMIFLLLAGCAGYQRVPDAELTFDKVVEAPGYTKEQIFNGAKLWISQNLVSKKAVLEYEDKDAGALIGNGIIEYPRSGMDAMLRVNWKVRFTMRVDIKDQKFRMTFSNLTNLLPGNYHKTWGTPPSEVPVRYKGELDGVKSELLTYGEKILASLGKDKSKSDW